MSEKFRGHGGRGIVLHEPAMNDLAEVAKMNAQLFERHLATYQKELARAMAMPLKHMQGATRAMFHEDQVFSTDPSRLGEYRGHPYIYTDHLLYEPMHKLWAYLHGTPHLYKENSYSIQTSNARRFRRKKGRRIRRNAKMRARGTLYITTSQKILQEVARAEFDELCAKYDMKYEIRVMGRHKVYGSKIKDYRVTFRLDTSKAEGEQNGM